MKKIILLLIKGYSVGLSPFINIAYGFFGIRGGCRFYPTCSNYAYQAIQRYGIILGSLKALKRLGRCHPFGENGNDPLI